ncbi:plastin-1-like [Varroa jacobsoni]|uniref:Calponin-homology (CH) domain-containing protein n=1 Tax=Varroa destructor TaxID=109461 RepID=A0A7M7K4A1_VARDE|nr:plastin-1-like [Varroa destructor]XP_022688020.1 plastin-1-like [Varroa jacobsoni]
MNRHSLILSDEQREDLVSAIPSLENNGFVNLSDLKEALDLVGVKMPQWQIRNLTEDMSKEGKLKDPSKLSFEEFQKLYTDLRSKDESVHFKKAIQKNEKVKTIGGSSNASSEGTTHSVRFEEEFAFASWMNRELGGDPDLVKILPINEQDGSLYEKMKDGILLCKMINKSCPDTIDERAINKKNLSVYTKHENLTLALNSAQAIGCYIINIDAHDLSKGVKHLVLALLWQIIKIGLFSTISLVQCPGLVALLEDGEEIAELNKLSQESILLRWVNHHLAKSQCNRKMTNFTSDIKDSEIYTYLLQQIAPQTAGVHVHAMTEPDLVKRADIMLDQADKLGCRQFVSPKDVVEGNNKLNMLFLANLFNNHPALDKPEGPLELDDIEESREEKTCRNWMNSMGVSPYVNWLYSDLADGLIIFQLFDIIRPRVVNWQRVHRTFSKLKGFMEKLENCNYAVELAVKEFRFSLVGVAGQDINDGNATLTLAVVWQLMRAYTLNLLSKCKGTGQPVVEKEIVEWVNAKLAAAGKESRIGSFQDQAIATSRPVLDLVDAITPGAINYSQVKPGDNEEERLGNAKYAISIARKTGARIYALPEDIAEVKPKMVMTVFACLMARDYVPNMGAKE